MSFLQRNRYRTCERFRAARLGELLLVQQLPFAFRGDEVALGESGAAGPSSKLALLALAAVAAGCAGGTMQIPPPRPVVIYSGARLHADYDEMVEVHDWFVRSQENIVRDPSFWVVTSPSTEDAYLWSGHRIAGDTVWTSFDLRAPESRWVQMAYAHLRLMERMGRLEAWLPEAARTTGYALERAIVGQCARAWLLARTVFGAPPYGPLDELVYADEANHLDAYIFTARPSEFAAERTEWARANPDAAAGYREWFLETFNREPPGLRAN